MHGWVLIASLLIICQAAFAAQAIGDITFMVPAVAVIVAAFLGIMYMIANSTSNPQLEAWTKTEIREYAAALILCAIAFGVFMAAGGGNIAGLIGGNGGGSGSTYINSTVGVLDSWTGNPSTGYDEAFVQAIRAAAKIRTGATYSPFMSVPIWIVSLSYSTDPLGGMGIVLLPLNMAASGLSNAIYIAEGIRLLIIFSAIVVPPILLPLSLCLRLIPFSRKLGNTMIAVCVAAFILLPASVLIAEGLNDTLGSGRPAPTMDLNALDADPWAMEVPGCSAVPVRALLSTTDPVFAAIVCLPTLVIPGAYAVCYPIAQNIIYPLVTVTFQLANTVVAIAWEAHLNAAGYADTVFNTVYPFLSSVNSLVLLAYLDFIMVGAITVAGARSLSAILGGEWYMAGISRLI
jgi:hypothetical protein